MNKIQLDYFYPYTLFLRLTEDGQPVKSCPFVVAFKYDKKSDSWQQGHYFTDLKSAFDFLYKLDTANEKTADKIQSMIHHIAYNNNTFTCSCCLDTAEELFSLSRYLLGADQTGIFEDEYNEIMEDDEE